MGVSVMMICEVQEAEGNAYSSKERWDGNGSLVMIEVTICYATMNMIVAVCDCCAMP